MTIKQLDIPYQIDSADLFASFANKPYAMWLDSCYANQALKQKQGRFDIMAAEPHTVILTQKKTSTVIKKIKGETTTEQNSKTDPFTLTKQLLLENKIPTSHSLNHLPFQLGAIGYFAYDLGRQLEALPVNAIQDIELPDACIGFFDWNIIVDHQFKKSYLIYNNKISHHKIQEIFNTIKSSKTNSTHFKITKKFSSNTHYENYQKSFNQLKEHIRQGDCYQANLAHRFTAKFSGDPWQAYCQLRKANPAPYSAYIKLPKGAILSLSPERFLHVNQKQAHSKPIKGTSPRFVDSKKDQASAQKLINSQKDKAENTMIVDLLRNDLGKCCITGSVKVPHLCALESFSNVHHLVSTITGQLKEDQHALDLLRKCFPGGSITGAPKISAMKIIEQLEKHQRSIYCGSIGYFDQAGNMDTNIAIRTLLCDQNKIHCYAGGGIVHESQCESEYQETLDKVGKLIHTLQTTLKMDA